jgi:RNA polymerase sigma-70 factor (ECF subfamily)
LFQVLLVTVALLTKPNAKKLSQFSFEQRCYVMDAQSEAAEDLKVGEAPFDFEATFRSQYGRIARAIAWVVQDPARAEELAVEVFVKLWRTPQAQSESAHGWLYRAAIRKGLDELRHRMRWNRCQRFLEFIRPATPEEIRARGEEQERVRLVLAVVQRRQAELLLLHSHGLRYDEIASALDLNPASIGTLLGRAQETFRKEYIRRYGKQ